MYILHYLHHRGFFVSLGGQSAQWSGEAHPLFLRNTVSELRHDPARQNAVDAHTMLRVAPRPSLGPPTWHSECSHQHNRRPGSVFPKISLPSQLSHVSINPTVTLAAYIHGAVLSQHCQTFCQGSDLCERNKWKVL